MRIISGKYKGRSIDGYFIDGTRPTMDRVKESLFAIIQNKLSNSICLDLFAGSGSLGIEALSNGALACYFVDNNTIAMNTIKSNINKLKIDEKYYLDNMNYINALKKYKNNNVKFDIIFLDPPYKLNLINDCLDKIIDYNLLNKNGIIVCEYEDEEIINKDLELIKYKKYGSKNIAIYIGK